MKSTLTDNELIDLCRIYGIDEKDMIRLLKSKEVNSTETTARNFYLGIAS